MKGQSLVFQVFFFLITGLFVFLAIGNFFYFQLGVFSQDVSEDTRRLLSSFVAANYIALKGCRGCDNATVVMQAQSSQNVFLQILLDKNSLNVISQPDGKVFSTSMHNALVSLADATGVAGATSPMVLAYARLQNVLTANNKQ